MSGPGDPPEGTPESAPGGGDDEYRSVVFDESFVRAAPLQEFSAQERIGDHAPAVRSRGGPRRRERGSPQQAVILVLLIAVAFATAVYMGVQRPYQKPTTRAAEPLRSTLVPLTPRGEVPGGAADDLYASSPARGFRIGAEGITLPAVESTAHFSDDQVREALGTAKDFLVHSALDADTLAGGDARAVRMLIDPDQLGQFDASLSRPADDGQHAATGWVMRFDPERVSLAREPVRVRGSMRVTELNSSALEVVADHTYVYAVRRAAAHAPRTDTPATGTAGTGGGRDLAEPVTVPHSLFTVRREARLRFDREDLRDHHVEVVESALQAGPQACATAAAAYLQPLFAGQSAPADASAGTNPYATGRPTDSLCGVLTPDAQPTGRR